VKLRRPCGVGHWPARGAKRRAIQTSVSALALLLLPLAQAQDNVTVRNTIRVDDGYTLAPGPNVEGVAFLRQVPEEGRRGETEWPPDVVRAFHACPWIDAASVRVKWNDLEPRAREFNWHPIDFVLQEVKKYNAAHPGARRTLQIRPMGGVHAPQWFEAAGVKYYSTIDPVRSGSGRTIRIPVPYDNPEYLKQLREVYRAMYERYKDEPLVTVYHGTWSAGPWDEIFHPQGAAPLPPDYTPAKFVQGMLQQLDVLIEEFSLKGKVAELPFSGKYPQKNQIDITGPITARIVERLGRRSPFLFIQTNGWGTTSTGVQTVSWGHEPDINDAYGKVNLAFQALGANSGGGWMPQGDWLGLVRLAEKYEVAYTELYAPDFMPLDIQHHIVEAFTEGFQPWLKHRHRTLYVREGTVRQTFRHAETKRPARLTTAESVPPGTSVNYRMRTHLPSGAWSDWTEARSATGAEVEVEATLHTDDGYLTPRVIVMGMK
jgi:hypothetical protein